MRSLDEMPDHERSWEALRRQCDGTVHSSYYLNRAWLQAFEGSARPRIVVVEEKGSIVGLAPLCSYRYSVKGVPIKVLSLAGDLRGRLRLSTNSILVSPGRPDVLEAMLREIKKLNWSILWTINMGWSPQTEAYVERVRETWLPIERTGQAMVTVPLPAEGDVADGFDRGARKNLRRIMNKLEREGVRVELAEIRREQIDRAVDEYARQHIERWESRGGSYFRNPENVRFLKLATREAYDRGQGYAAELLINGDVAAQYFIYIEGGQAYGERIGMSQRHADRSPGWLIMYHVMGELRSRRVHHLHVGPGTEQYKYAMGGQETILVGIGAIRGAVALLARLPMLSVDRLTGLKEDTGV
ncbi:MAG: GNAT family N-acetyltransferase [Methanomassiliicoccus sp.]|nr:GNAT family N-acetyltransferase [Methanomassiliicoccus sp.]